MTSSALLPIAQGMNTDTDCLGKLRLREAHEASQSCHVLPEFELYLDWQLGIWVECEPFFSEADFA